MRSNFCEHTTPTRSAPISCVLAVRHSPTAAVLRRGQLLSTLRRSEPSQRTAHGARGDEGRGGGTHASTVSSAMRLYVVHFPPATVTRPESDTMTTCSRLMAAVSVSALFGSRTSGRMPLHADLTDSVVTCAPPAPQTPASAPACAARACAHGGGGAAGATRTHLGL